MLLDRMCPGGGWNAGNSLAFGVPYSAYIDATSLALLALRGHEDQSGVPHSLTWLRGRIDDCPALYSLAWGILALSVYRHTNEEVLARANQALVAIAPRLIDVLDTGTLALSALALDALQGDNAFEVA